MSLKPPIASTSQPVRSPLPIALTVALAVEYSNLSRSRLYELMKNGQLPSFQVGGRRMIFRATIDDFFAKLAEAA